MNGEMEATQGTPKEATVPNADQESGEVPKPHSSRARHKCGRFGGHPQRSLSPTSILALQKRSF